MSEQLIWTAEIVDKASGAMRAIQGEAKKTDSQFTKMGQGAKKAGKLMAAGMAAGAVAAVAAGKAIFDLTQNVANAGDEAAKTARRVNSTAEAIQELDYAAGLSGTTIGVVEKALLKLGENAAKGKQEFEQLGISVTDSNGQLKGTDQLLNEVADALLTVENDTERSALAMKLLGKGGTEMASLLAGGSAAIKDMRSEARELGIVMSNEAAANAEIFNDNLARLEARFTAITQTIAVTALPVFSELFVQLGVMGDELGSTASTADRTREAIEGVLETIEAMSPAVTVLMTTVGVLRDGFGALDIIGSTLALTVGHIAEGYYQLDAAIDGGQESRQRLQTHQKRLAELTDETKSKIEQWGDATINGVNTGEQWRSKIGEITGELKGANTELSKFASFQERARERARAARDEFLTYGPAIPAGFKPPTDKPKSKPSTSTAPDVDLVGIIATAQKEAEAAATIESRRNLVAQLRLQTMQSTGELQQIELERAQQLLDLQLAIADGELTRTEQVLRRAEIEKQAEEQIRALEQRRHDANAKAADDRMAAMKALAAQQQASTLQGIADAKTFGGVLVGAFQQAQAPAAVLDVLRGGFMAAEAVGLAAINPFAAVQAGIGAALHFANAAKFGAGGKGGASASAGSAGAAPASNLETSKRVAKEAFVEAFQEVNSGGAQRTVVMDFSGATFVGRDKASARDLANLINGDARLKLGGN